MMNSFGRQEGGGFRRREGKLVSPVRRDYPLHQQTDRREKEGEETGRKEERNPPKVPPRKGKRGGKRRKKDVNERKK